MPNWLSLNAFIIFCWMRVSAAGLWSQSNHDLTQRVASHFTNSFPNRHSVLYLIYCVIISPSVQTVVSNSNLSFSAKSSPCVACRFPLCVSATVSLSRPVWHHWTCVWEQMPGSTPYVALSPDVASGAKVIRECGKCKINGNGEFEMCIYLHLYYNLCDYKLL